MENDEPARQCSGQNWTCSGEHSHSRKTDWNFDPIDTIWPGFLSLDLVRVFGGRWEETVFSVCTFSCLTFKNLPTFSLSTGVCVHTGATAAVSIYTRSDFDLLHRKYCKWEIYLKLFLEGAVRNICHCVAVSYTLLAAQMYWMILQPFYPPLVPL